MEVSFKELRDILIAASKEGATMVSIRSETKLSSKKANYYFDVLSILTLLSESNGVYYPTPGGAKFVRDYDNGFRDKYVV